MGELVVITKTSHKGISIENKTVPLILYIFILKPDMKIYWPRPMKTVHQTAICISHSR